MYEFVDAAVARAAVLPEDGGPPTWPDLTRTAHSASSWRTWVSGTLRIPGFEATLELACPDLARRAREIRDGRDLPAETARRVVLAMMRYLLRARSRATPFGLFAGVAPVRVGDRAEARLGTAHRGVIRIEADWVLGLINQAEADPGLRRTLTVSANNLAHERDGFLLLEHRLLEHRLLEHRAGEHRAGERNGDVPQDVRIRRTPTVRAALALAATPVRFADLPGQLAARFPGVAAPVIDRMLAALLSQGLLVTSLRPAMTETDPLGLVARETDASGAVVAARLRHAATGLRVLEREPFSEAARAHRTELAAALARARVGPPPVLSVDLWLDWHVMVPQPVADEAARAAGALVRLAPRRNLSAGWAAWHERFLERYGPRAIVPVLDAVDPCAGIGYPAGYTGGPAAAARSMTDRDTRLMILAQDAALRGHREVEIDDALIGDLAVADPGWPVQPSAEVTVRVLAASAEALTRGEFTLAITGVARSAGTTAGHFLDLFDDPDRQRMAARFAVAPTATAGAINVQVSASPRHTRAADVARVPRVTARLIRLGEHTAAGNDQIRLDDIAVTADEKRIWLLWLPSGQVIEPTAFHAVDPVRHTHPLARFLAEAPRALSVPCSSFDWGAAATLPFLPALRYGQTIISPALWRLAPARLPGRAASRKDWEEAFAAWRGETGVPGAVFLGDSDQRIRLDLAEPAHRVLLRTELDRAGTSTLRAAPDTAASGWAQGHVMEITLPVAATAKPGAAPWWLSPPVSPSPRDVRMPGGEGARFLIKLYASRDIQTAILTRHVPALAAALGRQARCWFLRHRDPADHLRLRVTVPGGDLAAVANVIGDWCEDLRAARLISIVQWDTYYPETARFGGPAVMETAEDCFAADSATAIAELKARAARGGPDPRALTAASMLSITAAMTGGISDALTWFITRNGPAAPAYTRGVYDQAAAFANPNDRTALRAVPGGELILTRWDRRREALVAYRRRLEEAGTLSPLGVLPDLLHLYQARVSGTGGDEERACLHLARAAALILRSAERHRTTT